MLAGSNDTPLPAGCILACMMAASGNLFGQGLPQLPSVDGVLGAAVLGTDDT
jgi:hypothetical protein